MRAFTLIELLVVISISAIRARCFCPAAAKQAPAQRIFRVNGLKQIGLAFRSGSVDTQDRLSDELLHLQPAQWSACESKACLRHVLQQLEIPLPRSPSTKGGVFKYSGLSQRTQYAQNSGRSV